MQGWRKTQEDAHIARCDLPDNVCLFAVFDGHGGKEVSIFVKEKFVAELTKLEEYKTKNYGDALKKCFRRMDTIMEEPEGKARLK
jgi:serine/threonine protein phosphatase PrpC